ncbi:amino acid/amide ABC transporter substrate-binding protein, HAAT family (TC 3.A.1.4.-) [Enhydrobacter aerosaccus]|uniref:Amino acid/amide ABC transporter substrate-binding protein, HAAT family (TC 3.A.1.4.-) n=1 Tax=Enhydrobacter aerosaccus TaxID=225324 RepID=A0A1T4K955_9HYPH|nr:ABC transporter substrate-binding protein [Enhydrobacter aerosaccus]SJZ38845.1 amino acid/amide ABC transporter substrate-binding protein, HAAT family (TC 3.A.1.4.-) [Enhydrobacter aerosaccus]
MSDGIRLTAGRRKFLAATAAVGGLQLSSPFIIKARGDVPVKIGFIDPITGSLSALAVSEVEGAKWTVDQMNKKGGILGRPVQLLVEDSANDTGTGVQKAHKLIERDKVDVIMGDVNSGIAYAIMGVTSDKKVLHIVPGGHTDPITGKDCKWNTFRTCNTTAMDAAAVTGELVKRFGKKWFFVTPDYAYGQTLQANFVKNLEKLGGTWQGDMLPIANADFSATLIKAKAFKPDVLLNNMGGAAQINCMKQFVQFGMAKEMALGGALFEIEAIRSVPKEAQTGWWVMEWYWNQPNVPQVKEFVDAISPSIGNRKPTARHWMAYVSLQAVKLAAEKAKTLEAVKMAQALSDLELPPDVSLSPNKIKYRAGDHQLMSDIFVGQVHPPGPDGPDDLFKVEEIVTGEKAAGPAEETGCKLVWPS